MNQFMLLKISPPCQLSLKVMLIRYREGEKRSERTRRRHRRVKGMKRIMIPEGIASKARGDTEEETQ